MANKQIISKMQLLDKLQEAIFLKALDKLIDLMTTSVLHLAKAARAVLGSGLQHLLFSVGIAVQQST